MAQGRRLSELLEEQQEPFFLDIYLIENGYSTRILESQATSMCWPGNASRRMQKLTSNGFKRNECGLLRCMVSKILYSKAVRKALNWEAKAPEIGASTTFDGLSSNGSKPNDWSGCSRSSGDDLVGNHGQWRCMEVDSKQHSPVSVLDLHSYESSPVYSHNEEETPPTVSSIDSPNEALDVFKDVLDAADSPASNQFGLDFDKEGLPWEIPKVDQAKITQLIVSELSNSRLEWSHFQPQMREIGVEIEAAIFEEICDEAVVDIVDFHCT
ncbi:uncharacterized protein [Typha angustifolia]|uniref:uncharacterized protein n=1 Tax=Typha angustifolia TaxID=59011 RepID=UPI003C2ED7EB